MPSTIMITGSTDGIGLETAKHLAGEGHRIVIHGRNPEKLEQTSRAVDAERQGAVVSTVEADLSHVDEIDRLEQAARDAEIDVLVNNAGVFSTSNPVTSDGLDVRFVVNTIAPYILTRRLLPTLSSDSRVINLSSAAQASVDLDAMEGRSRLSDGAAYAQSKLALTMWSRHLADELGDEGPAIIAVNPGSKLATKMVKDAFGVTGNDIGIGVDILTRAALSDEFDDASGAYYDNDSQRFADPHPDALDPAKNAAVVGALDRIVERLTQG